MGQDFLYHRFHRWPFHHRVHHGRNPRYIDRNHGGTLIVWDRLFGTFGEEREEPVLTVSRGPSRAGNVPAPRGIELYVLGQFVVVNLATVAFLYASPRLLALPLAVGALGITVLSLGGLVDGRPCAPRLEAARIVAAGLALAVF